MKKKEREKRRDEKRVDGGRKHTNTQHHLSNRNDREKKIPLGARDTDANFNGWQKIK